MAKILLRATGGWEEFGVQLGVVTPRAILEEVVSTLRRDFVPLLSGMRANLSGGVLKRQTGETYNSVKSRVRVRDNRVVGTVGSRFFVARLWEDGFVWRPHGLGRYREGQGQREKAIGSRSMPARKWAEPVVRPVEQRIAEDVYRAIDRGMARSGL